MSSRRSSVIDERLDSSHSYECSKCSATDSEAIHKSVINLRFPVYIESMTGITFRVDVFPIDTIHQIKQQLENTEGIPVAQQHLIWRYEELSNDMTINDYGIGFGAQMRLVVGLITGPVFRSADITDTRSDAEKDICDSNPLTFLLLQNLDQIKLISIKSGEDDNKYLNDNKSKTVSSEEKLSETLDFEKLNLRENEDKVLKHKMNEIQNKMHSISLKRNENKMHLKQQLINGNKSDETTHVSKLPLLDINLSKSERMKANAGIHLPPISQTFNSSGNPTNEWTKSGKQFNLTKQIQMSLNDRLSIDISSNRRHSSTTPNARQRQLFRRKQLNGSEIWLNNSGNNSLTTPRRPFTAPIVKHINDRDMDLGNRLSITEYYVRKDLRFKQNCAKTKRLDSGKRLPLILSTSHKKTTKKMRCSQCRAKLTIVNRFHCRCGLTLCAKHRYSETHFCSHDYKEEGKKYLIQNNPIISAEKLPKI